MFSADRGYLENLGLVSVIILSSTQSEVKGKLNIVEENRIEVQATWPKVCRRINIVDLIVNLTYYRCFIMALWALYTHHSSF